MSDNKKNTWNRRRFLKDVAVTSGATPMAGGWLAVAASGAHAAAPEVSNSSSVSPANAGAVGYVLLSPDEAVFIETLVNVMCPADAYTPSGVDCGLAVYIDRQLAGAFGSGAKRYLRGPFKAGRPEQGSQSPLPPAQHVLQGIAAANRVLSAQTGKSIDMLPPSQVESFLHDLESGAVHDPQVDLTAWFNDWFYPLFVQACFADPIYGGNAGKVFWKMIGYPGLPATHTLDMVRYRNKPFPGVTDPKSIVDFS